MQVDGSVKVDASKTMTVTNTTPADGSMSSEVKW